MTTTTSTSYPCGLLPIWLHITLSFLFLLLGFGSGILLAIFTLHRFNLHRSFLSQTLSISLILACTLLPHLFLIKCIPARCPKCAGKSWGKMLGKHKPKTFHYVCTHCRNSLDTKMNPD